MVSGDADNKRVKSGMSDEDCHRQEARIWHLYVIETAAGALYTGITTDVERRLDEHRKGRGAKALRGKGPMTLVYQECIGGHGDALRREAAFKRLSATAKRQWLKDQDY